MSNESFAASLQEPLQRALNLALQYLPNIAGALFLALAGLVLAMVLRSGARALTRFLLERVAAAAPEPAQVEGHTGYRSLPAVVGGLVFWIVLLFFAAAGVEALRLPTVSALVNQLAAYLPRVVAATVVIFAGVVFADIAGRWASGAAAKAPAAPRIGRAVQVLVICVAALVAVEQLGIDSTVLVVVMSIAATSVLGAAALAFGLGARTTVANILASHYAQKAYRVGQVVRIGEHEGAIVGISRTAVSLDTPAGRVLVPARHFEEQVSLAVSEEL